MPEIIEQLRGPQFQQETKHSHAIAADAIRNAMLCHAMPCYAMLCYAGVAKGYAVSTRSLSRPVGRPVSGTVEYRRLWTRLQWQTG